MKFQNYCFACEKTVTAYTVLSGDDLLAALRENGDVEVMHASEQGDHGWRLNNQEKENLRNAIDGGVF